MTQNEHTMLRRASSWSPSIPSLTMRQMSAGAVSAVVLCMCLYLVVPNDTLGATKAMNPAEIRAVLQRSKRRLEYTRRAMADVSWRPKDVLLMTHRGCVQRYPENSLAAIAACSEEGAHMVEIDLDMTRDGHVIMLHDATLERTTNRRSYLSRTTLVTNLTLKEVQSNYWLVQKEDTNTLTSFRVPTLTETLQVARFCGIHLKLDLKERQYLTNAVLKDIEREDAFDFVLVPEMKSGPKTRSFVDKVRSIRDVGVMPSSSVLANKTSYPAVWYTTSVLRQTPHDICQLREQSKTAVAVSILWDKGEYYLRDPELARKKFPLHYAGQSYTHEPCASTHDAEEPCLGAHLFQPWSKATCTRILLNENPLTARAALMASRQMAPAKRFPLEPIRFFQRGVRRAMIPACFEAWEQSRKDTNGAL